MMTMISERAGGKQDAMTTIATGRVSGYDDEGVTVFKGIPYAESPFGEHRFAAPAPRAPWEGTFEATRFGPRPPQPAVLPGQPPWSSADGLDILTVNVWTADPGGSGLPVMVWIHGGAYWMGSSDWPDYDGVRLARDGVVVVTLNYRIGMEGYGHVPGAPANRGLLDQVAALRWVRENIAAFGGDPDRVTVFGGSAGAGAVAALMTMPSAEGLFGRAIAQSVPGLFLTADHAARVTEAIMRAAGGGSPYERSPEELTAASAVAAGEITGDPGRWGAMAFTAMPFAPVIDGEVLQDTPWRALAAGAARDVALLTGFTRDEFKLFHALGGGPLDLDGALKVLAPDGAGAAYRAELPGATDEELYSRLLSDWMFRMPSALLAAAHTGPAYLYELIWAPDPVFGACHGLETPLVFGATGGYTPTITGGSPDTEDMSAQFRTAWTRFAATGDPGWPRYGTDTATTHLFDVHPRDADDPEAVSRALWTPRGFPPIG